MNDTHTVGQFARLGQFARRDQRQAAIIAFLSRPELEVIGATIAAIHAGIGGGLSSVYGTVHGLEDLGFVERLHSRWGGAYRLTAAGRALVALAEEAAAASQEPAERPAEAGPALVSPEPPAGRRKAQDATSRFWGVYWDPSLSRWRAQIGIGLAAVKLGNFPDETDAARVYDAASRLLGREEARCNFPGSSDGLARKLAWRALASAGFLSLISKAAA